MAITVAEKILKLLNSSGQALRVGYDGSNYAGFQTDASGDLTIDVTGSKVTVADALNVDLTISQAGEALVLSTDLIDALDDVDAELGQVTVGTGPNRLLGTVGSTYALSNVTEDRTFDANSTTTAELADILGTLISDLGLET